MLEPQRIRLANLPTPLVKLERLGRELGGAELWMKRDDLTGLEASGNKVRKLEYVVADALAGDCDLHADILIRPLGRARSVLRG